jgi:hypothetical protein
MWNPRQHTDEENLRWCWLRACEWGSWPAFLSQAIAPLAMIFTPWWVVLGAVLALNTLWAVTVRYRFVSANAAGLGVFVALLRWLTCPSAAFYLWWNGAWVGAAFALLWPLIATMLAGIPPVQIGVVQKQFMAKLGYSASPTWDD